MNEHAKKIWKAWADGKQVQTHQSDSGEWKTLEPIQVMPEMMPHRVPDRWRIKKAMRTMYYRVYLDRTCNRPRVFEEDVFDMTTKEFVEKYPLIEWLTPWLTYEMEVEE